MRWALLALVATLLGCATPVRPPTRFATADAVLAAADRDVEAGRWRLALDKLQAAEQQFAGEPAIAKRRAELAARWGELRTELEDRLTLVRAQARWEELALLRRLELAESGNFLNQFQLEQKKTVLLGQRTRLMGCALRQLNANLELAQRCADLAHSVQPGSNSRRVRQQVLAKQAAAAAALEAEQAAKQAKVAAQMAQQLQFAKARLGQKLERAQDLADKKRYVRALALVQQVLENEPDNQAAQALQAQLQENLAKQSRVLSELADGLYGESKVEAAIRLWEASLRLVPDQPDVVERYERAKRVQGNLQELREAPTETSGAVQGTGP